MLALPASWFSGSAFILRIRVLMQDHQPAALGPLNHNDLWGKKRMVGLNSCSDTGNEHRPKCEGETIGVWPMQQNPSPSKPYPVLHYETLCKGRRQTMDTELVRVYTGEKIFWGHNSSRWLHPTQYSKCSEKSKLTKTMDYRGLPLFS